jgi:hypothetical protein
MGFRFPRTAILLLPLILASAARLFAQAPEPLMPPTPAPVPKSSMLLLHYRWQRDSLTLIKSERVPAAIKPSRSSPEKRARGPATGEEPRSAFSFELSGADGKRISTRYLRDPGLRRVEYQEKGRRGLKSQEERVDSADIFLRIPEADAKTIRFFRHGEPASLSPPSPPSPSKAGANGTAGGASMQGSEPRPAKTMVAEFPLE